ncbi:hypothetical protein B0J18DRAFT_467049 [Chaetomium sp. MPI-SDFR-AT-0129]|nr:hypothetical protein B0J18DRAFT_467049 [Chaetomium sp. MPI-SDFR-AT-0129]
MSLFRRDKKGRRLLSTKAKSYKSGFTVDVADYNDGQTVPKDSTTTLDDWTEQTPLDFLDWEQCIHPTTAPEMSQGWRWLTKAFPDAKYPADCLEYTPEGYAGCSISVPLNVFDVSDVGTILVVRNPAHNDPREEAGWEVLNEAENIASWYSSFAKINSFYMIVSSGTKISVWEYRLARNGERGQLSDLEGESLRSTFGFEGFKVAWLDIYRQKEEVRQYLNHLMGSEGNFY